MVSRGSRLMSMSIIGEIGQSYAEILTFSNFSKCGRHHLRFSNLWNFIGRQCLEGPDSSSCQMSLKLVVCCGDITFFRIFKMAAAAIVDFWNSKILLAIVAEKVETHQHAKLYQNRTIGCEDIKIFSFSQDGGRHHLGLPYSQNYWQTMSGGPRRITVLNIIKIGRSIAAISRYCKFSKWRPPPSWIFEIVKIYWLLW